MGLTCKRDSAFSDTTIKTTFFDTKTTTITVTFIKWSSASAVKWWYRSIALSFLYCMLFETNKNVVLLCLKIFFYQFFIEVIEVKYWSKIKKVGWQALYKKYTEFKWVMIVQNSFFKSVLMQKNCIWKNNLKIWDK